MKEDKIKVGEYVRTRKYGIKKIVPDGRYVIIDEDKNRRMYYVDQDGIPSECEFAGYVWSDDIVKHSKNIIDLIQVGDYVNGYLVEKVEKVPNEEIGKVVVLDTDNVGGYDYYAEDIYKEEIKSIVTKEQFKSMEYRLEESNEW